MKTALITGASGGIGHAFVECFIRHGYNVILVARNEAKLQAIAQTYKDKSVSVTYYAMDLSDMANCKKLYQELKSSNRIPDCLINDAGYGLSGHYCDMDWDAQYNMFSLNMMAVAYLTHALGKEMQERGSGHIVNVASTAAFMAIPNLAGYAASKAFVLSLSDAANTELRPYGVSVTALCPGVTRTHFHEVAHTERSLLGSWFLPQASATEVAEYGFKCMLKNKPIAIHHWMNRLSMGVVRIVPKSFLRSMLYRSLKS